MVNILDLFNKKSAVGPIYTVYKVIEAMKARRVGQFPNNVYPIDFIVN